MISNVFGAKLITLKSTLNRNESLQGVSSDGKVVVTYSQEGSIFSIYEIFHDEIVGLSVKSEEKIYENGYFNEADQTKRNSLKIHKQIDKIVVYAVNQQQQ